MNTKFVLSKCNITGVIWVEAASNYHKLSTFPEEPVLMISSCISSVDCRYFSIQRVDNLNLDDTDKLMSGLYVTNAERTICDMVRYDSEERFIYESIETYGIRFGVYEKLLEIADKYEVREQVEEYINSLADWQEDFYGE